MWNLEQAPNTIISHAKLCGAILACHDVELCIRVPPVDQIASSCSLTIRMLMSKWRAVKTDEKARTIVYSRAIVSCPLRFWRHFVCAGLGLVTFVLVHF